MTVYTSFHNLMTGQVRVAWNKMLLCTCDGYERDEKEILEMMRDTYRRGGKPWNGWIHKVNETAWVVKDHSLIIINGGTNDMKF